MAHSGTTWHTVAQTKDKNEQIMSTNIRIRRICKHCRKQFTAKTTKTQYCGDRCANKAHKWRTRDVAIAKSEEETRKMMEENLERLSKYPFLNVNQVCLMLGISRRTLYRMMNKNQISFTKLGGRTIFMRESIYDLFQNQKPSPLADKR
jgi:excisionase family DNA binding protein